MPSVKLPFPPSCNSYWRHSRGMHFLSAAGKAYRTDVMAAILSIGWNRRMQGRLSVEVYAVMPDRRKRDLDNLHKGLLDSLTAAGVWEDDGQIDRLLIQRGEVDPPGYVIVSIESLTPNPESE